MIKLCNICDKANVPHHVVDDIVNLLRECEEKDIKFQACQLHTRRYFLKHLDEQFKSPQPQLLVTGLEGFSSNDINYLVDIEILLILFVMISKNRQWI